MTTDRTDILFKVQCTLFCLFYGALLFVSIVYFRQRFTFITEALGAEAVLPGMLTFARSLHHPAILVCTCVAPIVLVIFAWSTKPHAGILLAQAILMLVLVLLAFVPPMATEVATSSILEGIHAKAKERGLTR